MFQHYTGCQNFTKAVLFHLPANILLFIFLTLSKKKNFRGSNDSFDSYDFSILLYTALPHKPIEKNVIFNLMILCSSDSQFIYDNDYNAFSAIEDGNTLVRYLK